MDRIQQAVARLEEQSGSAGWLEPAVRSAADPGQAVSLLERWLSGLNNAPTLLAHLAASPPMARLMAELLGASRHAGAILAQNPDLAGLVLDPGELLQPFSPSLALEEGRMLLASADSYAYKLDRLRFMRQEMDLRIMARDLAQAAGPEETWRSISIAADTLLHLALETAWGAMTADGSLGGPPPLAIAAYGKLGGEELNFSSDLDLAFFVDPIIPEGSPEAEAAPRLAERLVRAMTDKMGRGSVHRIDLRLRPFGGAGPIAPPLSAFDKYLAGFAEPWEHMAMIRSRVCVGSPEAQAAWSVLREHAAFRTPPAEPALAGIFLMRQRSQDMGAARDIKRGMGGIRDAEFFVQALQLLWGPADASLRGRATLPCLRALAEAGKCPPEAAAELEEAYIFLRTAEHRRQMQDAAQVHDAPTDGEACFHFARSLGFSSREAFESRLAGIRTRARRWYGELSAPFLPAAEPSEAEALERLGEAGDTVAAAVRLAANKDQLWRALAENRSSADRFARLATLAPRLMAQAASAPSVLDQMVSGEIAEPFQYELRSIHGGKSLSPKEIADQARLAWLRLAVRWILSGGFSLERALSRLAEDSLGALASGLECPLSVVGLGSLARREMAPTSDADLMLMAGQALPPPEAETAARRMLAALAEAQGAGLPFRTDFRLRPDGRQGPLATRAEALDRYRTSRMEPWERLAWARPALVSGPSWPLRALRLASQEGGLSQGELASLLDMKRRIERERSLGPGDIKLGPGGLDDIQWLIGLNLLSAPGSPESPETSTLIDWIREIGRLSRAEAGDLARVNDQLINERHHLELAGKDAPAEPALKQERAWVRAVFDSQVKLIASECC
jgi:glutamate-ammonia-ligase adenylyltransferase